MDLTSAERKQFKNSHFKVLSILGSGTFGKVFQCQDTRTRQLVAVKVPSDYNQIDTRERQFLLRLHQSRDYRISTIVTLLEVVEVRGIPSLVLECLEMPLSSILDQGINMHISDVRCVGLQLFTAIDFLQDSQIVHGDIKPANIMYAGKENGVVRVKLIDLGGFEVNQENPPIVWEELTSRPYRTPEVVLGLPAAFKIDVWAVAVVLVEAVLGMMLFPARSSSDLVHYFHNLYGSFSDRLMDGRYVERFFETAMDGSFRMMDHEPPQHPCPLGSSIENLNQIVDDENKDYMLDVGVFVEFLERALHPDPIERVSAGEALQMDFFTLDHLEAETPHQLEAVQLVTDMAWLWDGVVDFE